MTWLAAYGEALRVYEGVGGLALDQGSVLELDCRFEVAQLSNGAILGRCRIKSIKSANGLVKSYGGLLGTCGLRGEMQDGAAVKIAAASARGPVPDSSGGCGAEIWLDADDLDVERREAPGEGTLRLGLTNLETRGHPEIHVGSRAVAIQRMDNYEDVISALHAARGSKVTGLLVVPVVSEADMSDTLICVRDLCWILSLAAGTYVTWLYYDMLDPQGEMVRTHHRSVKTRSFCPWRLICPEDVRDFVETCYAGYEEWQETCRLPAVIDAYLESKLYANGETKLSLAAIAMETLNSRFAQTHGWEHVVGSSVFGRIEKALKRALRGEFSDTLCAGQIEALGQKLPELRRRTFKNQVTLMCDRVGLKVGDDDLTWKELRDRVIHEGSFGCDYSMWFPEYLKLLHLIESVLMSIMGYDGWYRDCRHGYRRTRFERLDHKLPCGTKELPKSGEL
jgi:hypothetical protein